MLYGFLVWIALTLVVMALIGYRYFISLQEDDNLHLADSATPLIAQQNEMAAKLGRLDQWSRRLTMIDIGFGVLLGGLFVYNSLHSSGLL